MVLPVSVINSSVSKILFAFFLFSLQPKTILRDAYHHFKYPEEMMSSIRNQLKDDGYLFVLEATKDLKNDQRGVCKEAMTYVKVIETISKQGFILVEEKIVNFSYLMKFKKLK